MHVLVKTQTHISCYWQYNLIILRYIITPFIYDLRNESNLCLDGWALKYMHFINLLTSILQTLCVCWCTHCSWTDQDRWIPVAQNLHRTSWSGHYGTKFQELNERSPVEIHLEHKLKSIDCCVKGNFFDNNETWMKCLKNNSKTRYIYNYVYIPWKCWKLHYWLVLSQESFLIAQVIR